MKYVLDSSVVLKWVLPESDSARALRLLDDYRHAIHELVAPDIFPVEVANALVSAERSNRIKSGESAIFFKHILLQAPALHATAHYLVRAMEMSIQTRQAVYDCAYLAMAESESCELVTADDQFVRAVQGTFPFVVSLVTLP